MPWPVTLVFNGWWHEGYAEFGFLALETRFDPHDAWSRDITPKKERATTTRTRGRFVRLELLYEATAIVTAGALNCCC
jgi:hypothetical protein